MRNSVVALAIMFCLQPTIMAYAYTPPDKEDGAPERTGDAGSEFVLELGR